MAEMSEESVLGALEGAFGDAPKAAPAPKAVPAPAPKPLEADGSEVEEITLEPAEGESEAESTASEEGDVAPVVEPEFEILVDGQTEVVRGKEQITELLQKARHWTKGSEEVARVREILTTQIQQQQMQTQFMQAVSGDLAELNAMDKQLEQFNKIDWASAIDTDFVSVMKLQEQRAALREARNAKAQELGAKQQQFERGQAQATQQMIAAEQAALLAKVPEWRNNEKATAEKQAISRALQDYGYQPAELDTLTDHRALLVARDAMKWRELQRSKTDKNKQLRDAPPVVKPGAANAQQQPNQKANFGKFVQEFRQQGRKGNHRAQEAGLEKLLSRTFK
jgi:hypothetical protein